MPLRPAPPPRGILRTHAPRGTIEHQRILPAPELAASIAHFWSVRWALEEPFATETLSHPTVHVVIDDAASGAARASVAGVPTHRFARRLEGTGQVFGVKFRPAMFAPLWSRPMSTLTDRVVPIAEVFGAEGGAFAEHILAPAPLAEKIAHAEAFLAPRVAPTPPHAAELIALRDLVERMETDRALLRAEDAAILAGVDLRTLQRRFRRAVGVTPKWVIQRYRLHEAAERLKSSTPPPLAALAAELGYADQAHFARDFARVIGRSPRTFAAMEGA